MNLEERTVGVRGPGQFIGAGVTTDLSGSLVYIPFSS
jgi:hypothetical protein